MKAVLCPVCNGIGEVTPNWDAFDPNYKVTCHGCGGKGWVEVQDSHIPYPIETHEFIPFVDKCPACGGDRNSPPLTGCPLGSHYGTYCE